MLNISVPKQENLTLQLNTSIDLFVFISHTISGYKTVEKNRILYVRNYGKIEITTFNDDDDDNRRNKKSVNT